MSGDPPIRREPDVAPGGPASDQPLSLALVVLTMGNRPDELARSLNSVDIQVDVAWEDRVVVFNGVAPSRLPDGVRAVTTPNNVGVPAGRNWGAAATVGDVVMFLDDDARLGTPEVMAGALGIFRSDASVAAVGFRIVDEYGSTATRHVSRPGGRRPDDAGEVTAFLGGAVAIRRSAFDEVGGYAGEFFYAMEETDLALALIDNGWTIRYEPELVVLHPRTAPARHPAYLFHTARNRVLLARRRLPAVLGVIYVVNWMCLTAVREGFSRRFFRSYWSGTVTGIRTRHVARRRIKWKTIWRLCRLGRPPII